MPAADDVLISRVGRVLTATLNRPDQRNALTWEMLDRLRAVVADAKADPDVRVLVLTGAGDSAFCAGADLRAMGLHGPAERVAQGLSDLAGGTGGGVQGTAARGREAADEGWGRLAGLFEDLWAMGKPTVAKVRGYCLAGGFGLALACDLVVAADDATFGLPEVDVGLWPFMVTVPLCRAVPPKKALELMLTGRRVGAAEADRIGFVTRVVAGDGLDAATDELTSALAARSPTALRMGRTAFYEVLDTAAAEALARLHPLLAELAQTDDGREGLAAFSEKRPPTWTGR